MDHKLHMVHLANKRMSLVGPPSWSVVPMQGAWLRALVRVVDPARHNQEPASCKSRSHMLQ